jgi:hypothetical protein
MIPPKIIVLVALWIAVPLTLWWPAEAFAQGDDAERAAHAETPGSTTPLSWLLLPYVAGSTDDGISFGAFMILADEREEFDPYRYQLRMAAMASVSEGSNKKLEWPKQEHRIYLDMRSIGSAPWNLEAEFSFRHWSTLGYYGIGNATESKRPIGLDEKYAERYFEQRRDEVYGYAFATRPLVGGWRLKIGGLIRAVFPDPYDGSLISRDADSGRVGGGFSLHRHALIQLALGLIWDGRDKQLQPTEGGFVELCLRASPGGLTGESFLFGGLTIDARIYQYLGIRRLIFAARFLGDLIVGDPPFYELTSAGAFERVWMFGGWNGVRGIPEGRFHGRTKIMATTELRGQFVEFRLFKQDFQLGGVLFADAGRLWGGPGTSREQDGEGLGLKWGAGIGLRIRYKRSTLLKADLAYSPEALEVRPSLPLGIYFGLDHVF